MTTRVPNFDRVISRPQAASGLRLRYATPHPEGQPWAAGQWGYGPWGDSPLSIADTDSDGVTIPPNHTAQRVSINGKSYFLEALMDSGEGYWIVDTKNRERLAQGPVALLFDAAAGEARLWAARRDVRSEEAMSAGVAPVQIGDAVFTIRRGLGQWAVGDRFTDDDGKNRRVIAVVETGLRAYLEITARRVT